jgi:ectoine hydroxylase-related dioxygenase (phytanoyl-CoA dioxygenase family)
MQFITEGFCVVPEVLSPHQVEFVRRLSRDLIARHRAGEALVTCNAITVASVTAQHPQRNPGVQASQWECEPFIIGDLLALDLRFGLFLSTHAIWRCVAALLGCSPAEVVFHLSNLTRKPPGVGPAIGWHRDATNSYHAAADGRTVRLLFPLQPMAVGNGGTAVLPGSHVSRVHSAAADLQAAVCPSVLPGAALALHAHVLHGGSPNRSQVDRDVIVLQFGVRSSPLSHKANELLSMCHLEEVMAFNAKRLRANPSLRRAVCGGR